MAQVLGRLGALRLSNNLNQLAKAANTGSLIITPEIETTLRNAYAEIRWMRQQLMQALGFEEGE